MKNLFVFFILLSVHLFSSAQTNDQIVKSYINSIQSESMLKLNHGPISTNFGASEKAFVFFINSWNVKTDAYDNYGIIYNYHNQSFTRFGNNNFDPSYGEGVISVFFENVDSDNQNELIVIYEKGCRTFYADEGGYAGIRVWYDTKVFDFELNASKIIINEYKAMGELLTVNLPMQMGTFNEEELIGRESTSNLNDIIGVTYNTNQVKLRINKLKKHNLLGVNNN